MNTSIHLITAHSHSDFSGKISSMEGFVQTILEMLKEKLGPEYQVTIQKVIKNNGVVLTGVSARRAQVKISPTIYLDGYYKENFTRQELELLAEQLCSTFASSRSLENVDLREFMDFSRAGGQIAFKLIHAEKNKDFLKQVPHRRLHDLAAVFYYTLKAAPFCGNAMIVVRNEHMEKWQVTAEELYQKSMENMPTLFPAVIQEIEQVMEELLCTGQKAEKDLFLQLFGVCDEKRKQLPMYVLTNSQRQLGAACIMYPGVLQEFSQRTGQDLYLLPSSVHEMILIPALPGISPAVLQDIVADINKTQVAEEEVLTDSVYYYSAKRDSLEWLC